MLSASVFLLLVNLVFTTSRIFVPSITNGNDFKLDASDGGYNLTINHSGGFRHESVKEIAPGELQVKGQYEQNLGNNVYVHVTYEADRNGHIARYRIYISTPVTSYALPASVLKSNVG